MQSGTVLEGQVRLARSRRPLADARVYFVEAPGSVQDIAALTDESGRVSLFAPGPGRYRIECTVDSYLSAAIVLDISGDVDRVKFIIEVEED